MKKKSLKKRGKNTFIIFKRSLLNFGTNNPVNMAATTAYFAIFSLAPMLVIIISVFGFFTGDANMSTKLFNEVNKLIGEESTQVLKTAIDNYQITENSGIGAIIGIGFFLISATTLFAIMQNSINFIWRIKVKPSLKQNLLKLAIDRLFSFGVILSLGLVLVISLIIDASIAFLKDFLSTHFSTDLIVFAQVINIILSLAIIASIFALIYRFLPDLSVHWSASWFGATFTAILFALGKFLIGIIIGSSNLGAVYGAASSFVVILMWIYFVSIIFYFGVELTHQYSRYFNHENKPVKYATPFEISSVEKDK
ncbi:YihY/virulence factor BrkB family protein [uncultured Sunxiuqinia sp.]|uniref:YihY/virulence factor BrkB family protein n=1 Tax=uncultured Sunxiuqinia sp. TaxID=1573825 RepID=UPI002AA9221F|nr:YihY/virulence factor BrkB family protein [uncultured Sunxiuqinia sp.]